MDFNLLILNTNIKTWTSSNSVNGDSAKVVKTGVATEVVVNAGRKDERIETKYFESDKAWFKRIRQELGTGKGRCPHWLIFNEAHHAYRRGDNDCDSDIMVDLEERYLAC